ncbi:MULTISPECIES: DUF2179 domain-containing protein [unclassified Fusibacter]|uniref:DUF2179 domain-containing protein n=1 Tax=unclassified Fusibacter TaxID=2624464 RepID=UPI0010105841|nr:MULTISPECIES: DUF5698 domain-containing protein [unclassified Fusibacter]MCK8059624.1 DUF5698 domain-containing protein [Fusibacter sp. A2]NPE21425.1 DUF2179 domain-containing protein [Fusibacter sp. A1]RXV61837.1 DUF2179 domain-containing protein [Fusibacter sp. A1]
MLIYFLIFFGKIIEVSLMTLRVVLITKGERKLGAVIAFFEICLWMLIVSNVIDGLMDDPFKAIAYALGFSLGNYLGSWLENQIGIGTSQVQIIVRAEHGYDLSQYLYKQGYACTVVEGQGKTFTRNILYVIAPRKKVQSIIKLAKQHQKNAVISVHDTKPFYGGYGIRK